MCRCHAILPGFIHHYQDPRLSSQELQLFACDEIISMVGGLDVPTEFPTVCRRIPVDPGVLETRHFPIQAKVKCFGLNGKKNRST